MNMKTLHAFSFACITLLPISASAPWKDQHCQNLQDVLYAAVTDFREFRSSKTPGPDVSIQGTKLPCQMTTWANNVPMYICYAQVSAANADSWCTAMLDYLSLLQPTWHFQITSPAADHYMDAGPPDCEIPPTGGPYLGQCPLQLQSPKQTDGTAKLYLWMSSLSSPYLVKRPPSPPPKAASRAAITNGCDDLCQGLKKAFESRMTAFEEIRAAKSAADASDAALELAGAGNCTVSPAAKPRSSDSGTQCFCYWPESSAFAAEIKFRDLTARDAKQEVALYFSNQSVGLHIKAWH